MSARVLMTPEPAVLEDSMQYNASPGLQDSGTTDVRDETDDCSSCTARMPCYEHYLGERGRPAVRRVE